MERRTREGMEIQSVKFRAKAASGGARSVRLEDSRRREGLYHVCGRGCSLWFCQHIENFSAKYGITPKIDIDCGIIIREARKTLK